VKDRETREPASDLAKAVVSKAADKGLIIITCGMYGNVIRVMVPLTASAEVVDEGLAILEAALGEALIDSR
jgi:4-aminobutyrate aminotransferase/(S)-3-amino-2-methylpropionate transaminase